LPSDLVDHSVNSCDLLIARRPLSHSHPPSNYTDR
jgi:hypothetical protein